MARWLWENLSLMVLALFLGGLVWIVAVNEENPLEERALAQPVAIQIIKADDMILHEPYTSRAQVTIRAPRLAWQRLTTQQVHVVADLSGLAPGTQQVPLVATVDVEGATIVSVDPESITVNLEESDARDVPIDLAISGEPAVGYEAEQPIVSASSTHVSGPASAVGAVSRVEARISLADLKRDFNGQITLIPVATDGNPVSGVDLEPEAIQVSVPVTQKQGFREVAVKVVITGEVASGYQVTNISVAPSIITVGSSDPRLVQQMPGFVTTQPLDITDATDDIVRRLPLELPDGVTVSDEPTVVVQVSIAAIEYSATIARAIEFRGLEPGLSAAASPGDVDVILLGPLPVLDDLTLEDVRVVVDVTGLPPGTYQRTPVVELLPDSLRAENVLPGQIEIVISVSTATPTPAPSTPTASPGPPTATATATRRPPTATPAPPTATPTAPSPADTTTP